MSRPSSTSTNSANAFPRPAGATLPGSDARERLPAGRPGFPFEEHSKYGPDAETGLGCDPSVQNGSFGQQLHNSSRRRQYYEDHFAYKDDSTSAARDRVTNDAPVIAELQTNVIVR
jgi:hypothetical protein